MPTPTSKRHGLKAARQRPATSRDPNSLIKILISTDNHLGYLEKDTVRGDDSFRAFEEVLELAKANSVDMLLLGGDLFHENKPSRPTLLRTMRLLRSACLSPEGSVRLAVRSDPALVNYMNPAMAVSLPVFVIHGNHDDPTGGAGPEAVSALDVLAEAGLITYFGKHVSSRRVDVTPILLQKSRTALALYGMGNIRDEVLYQTWAKERNVKWFTPMQNPHDRDRERHLPETDTGGDDDLRWFNLFVLHQNRYMRGSAKAVSETLLPPWLDYVVWGHEHDSQPELTKTTPPVVQPGSTVATSLSDGESLQKHAILLEVYRGKLKHRKIPLQTVRHFKFEDICLNDEAKKDEVDITETEPDKTATFLNDLVADLIKQQEAAFDDKVSKFRTNSFRCEDDVKYPPSSFYHEKLTRHVRQPLIRLRVEISGNWEVPNPQRFGQAFIGRVAGATEILLYYRSRRAGVRRARPFLSGYSGDAGNGAADEDDEGMALSQNGSEMKDVVQIPKLVQYYLYHNKAGGSGLKFLELDELTGAVDEFVNKQEGKAITDYVASYLKKQQTRTLREVGADDNEYDESKLLEKFKAHASQAANRVLMEAKTAEKKPDEKTEDGKEGKAVSTDGKEEGQDKDDVNAKVVPEEARDQLEEIHSVLQGNPKTAMLTSAGRQLAADSDDSDDVAQAPKSTRGRGRATRGRGRGRARGRTSSTPARAAKPPTPSRRPRRAAAAAADSIMVDASDDEDEVVAVPSDEVQAVQIGDDEEMDDYVPTGSTRKRRASGAAAGASARTTRARRQESVAARASGSSGRFARRRNTATLNVNEESGDDAM